ncbi:MAG: 4-(cytidine 5'-diphospho)-2-C-methyl-D-erythritol kinase [Bacteroidia bacterium]
MIAYPNAKINLGLNITEKRPDGYHNIETVFYPVGWKDILELLPDASADSGMKLTVTGINIPGSAADNLCVKAYHLIAKDYPMPAVKAHLHKLIPAGAGLGGGSSDAAFTIRALNDKFDLGLAWGEMHHYARQLGADCSFFITNKPVIAEEKGDVYETIQLDLSAYEIVIVHSGIHVSTAEAYASVKPEKGRLNPLEIIQRPIEEWKALLINDFEKSVFTQHPAIGELKKKMYEHGAVYASMSGSGSAVFGIFRQAPDMKKVFPGMKMFCGKM